MAMKSPVMRYHGGKFRLAPWVISFFPPHRTYVEPFGGAGSVLMQKPPAYSEVYNDLNSELVTVFKVLRDPELSKKLIEQCVLTPYARDEFELAYELSDDPVETARRMLVRSQMGFGSAGGTKSSTGFRLDSAREYATAGHVWAKYPASIARFCNRLQGVTIENKDAMEIIDNHDRPETLFYVDPPYMPETRHVGRYYHHELTMEQHAELLDKLLAVQGMVVISGYLTDLYSEKLSEWQRHETKSRIASNRGTKSKTEVIWLNPAAASGKPQLGLQYT